MQVEWQAPEWREREDLAWSRLEIGDMRGARRAACEAINLEPNAIDSYVILAQTCNILGQKQAYAREAVRLGEIEFENEIAVAPSDDFPFWGVVETRPYMRSLHTLALALWEDEREGAKDEAIELAKMALRICPNDNMGVRLLLPEWLARRGEWSQGRELLRKYQNENRAEVYMWTALYAFQNGDREEATMMVSAARKTNANMVGQLLLKHRPKRRDDIWVAVGSIEVAKAHSSQAYDIWRTLENSVEWLSKFSRR